MKTTLTPLENKVLRLQANGYKLDAICHALKESKNVVEYRLYLARKKLGLRSIRDVFFWSLKLLLLVTLPAAAQPTLPTLAAVSANTNPVCANLAWDYETNILNTISGFKIYYGIATRNYTNSIGLNLAALKSTPAANGLVTFTNSVCGLVETQKYFFAVTAYDSGGAESDFSNEASWPRAALTNVVLTIRAQQSTNTSGPWWTPPAYTNVVSLTNPTGLPVWYRFDIQKRYQ